MQTFTILSCFCLIALSSGQWTPDPSCPYPSFEPVRSPYPGDCTKYWECFEGTKYAQECPSGLEFNAPLQQCDTPSIAKCDKDEKESTVQPVTGTTVEPTEPTSTWSPDPLCPYPSETIVYFPYPGDCSKYYECWEGNKYVYTCPPGLWWHEAISECDYKDNVDCGSSSVQPSSSQSPITKSTTTVGPTPKPPTCPTDTDDIVYFNYEGDCSKYWECYAGHATVMNCPTGLLWNEAISECDYKENVDCDSSNKVTDSLPVTVQPPTCPTDTDKIVYFNYDGDCSKYWECYAGHATQMFCPTGLLWNEAISECDYKENVNCGSSTIKPSSQTPSAPQTTTFKPTPKPPTCPTDTDDIVYFNYGGDCSKYWECYAGHATVMNCPTGLLWNEAISECDYKENVHCNSNNDKSATEESLPVTTVPSPQPSVCPSDTKEIIYFNYDGDCSKYWECYGGRATIMQCPSGLWWHEEISECDYKENVNCGSSTVKPTTKSPKPTTTSGPTPKPPVCPTNTEKISYFDYYGDCSKYWQCVNGHAVSRQCPKDLWWNDKVDSCDYKENVDCDDSSTLKPTTTTTTTTTTPTTTTTETPPTCPIDESGTIFYPYDGDCAKYWQCSAGTSTLMQCPNDLWWNQAIGRCDYRENVDCRI